MATPAPPISGRGRGRGKKKAIMIVGGTSGGPQPAIGGSINSAFEPIPRSSNPNNNKDQSAGLTNDMKTNPTAAHKPLPQQQGNKRRRHHRDEKQQQQYRTAKKSGPNNNKQLMMQYHEIATWWMPSTTVTEMNRRVDNNNSTRLPKRQLPKQAEGNKSGSLSSSSFASNNNEHVHSSSAVSIEEEGVITRDGVEVVNLNSLCEGENWVACSFLTDDTVNKEVDRNKKSELKEGTAAAEDKKKSQANKPLSLSIINSQRGKLYLDHRGYIQGYEQASTNVGKTAQDKIKPTNTTPQSKPAEVQNKSCLAVLCIDVDNEGHVVAIKDVRLGSSMSVNQGENTDTESTKVDGLEFFLARRRRPAQQPQTSNSTHHNHHQSNSGHHHHNHGHQHHHNQQHNNMRNKGRQHHQQHPSESIAGTSESNSKNQPALRSQDDQNKTKKRDSNDVKMNQAQEDDISLIASDSENDSSSLTKKDEDFDGTTSGYGTDDEKEINDEIEEMNERNGVRFCTGGNSDLLGPSYEVLELGGTAGAKGNVLHMHPPPPREVDTDKYGHLLYHPPEVLPIRQLRVLRDGDRILVRYWGPNHCKNFNSKKAEYVPCIKLEYLHGHQYHIHPTPENELRGEETNRIQHPEQGRNKNAAAANDNPAEAPSLSLGKPRLLSVKSADVKSYEKKRFTLNSTSAADAPTVDEDDLDVDMKHANMNKQNQKSPDHNADNNVAAVTGAGEGGGRGRKAGEDWSKVEESANKNKGAGGHEANNNNLGMLSSSKQGKSGGGGNKNANTPAAANEDDDDGMEEYSYLTGEVMIKDQDYISAITGDDATMGIPAPEDEMIGQDDDDDNNKDGDQKNKEEEEMYDGEGDAATASAVVLGATTNSPSKTTGRMQQQQSPSSRGLKEDSGKKDGNSVDDEGKVKKPSSEVQVKDDGGKVANQKSGETKKDGNKKACGFEAEEVLETNEGQDEFLTCRTSEHKSDDENSSEEENDSEEELLSQPDDVGGRSPAGKFEVEEESNAADDESDNSDESGTDVSKTQPFPLPKNIANRMESFSTTDDDEEDKKAEGEDSDASTVFDVEQQSVVAENGEVNEVGAGVDAQDGNIEEVNDQALKSHQNEAKKDGNAASKEAIASKHDDSDTDMSADNQQTQKFSAVFQRKDDKVDLHSPSKEAPDKNATKGHGDVHDSDSSMSDDEPTQKFPIAKPIDKIISGDQGGSENDSAYQAETQHELHIDDVYHAETQSLGAANVESPQKKSSPAKADILHQKEGQGQEDKVTAAVHDVGAPPLASTEEPKESADAPTTPPAKSPKAKLSAADEKMPAKTLRGEEKRVDESAAAKPAASKDVHFDLPIPSEKSSDTLEDKGPKKGDDSGQESPKPSSSSKTPPEQVSERRAGAATGPMASFDDSAVQKQRLENSAVHRDRSGAFMTGPVGGAIAFPNPPGSHPLPEEEPQTTKVEPKGENLLISYAMQSNDLNPNPLPDAAASSEETTVCQMDNSQLKKEQGSTSANGLIMEGTRHEKVAHSALPADQGGGVDERNGYADKDRDPNIPGSIEVCINTRGGHGRHSKGLSPPHHHRSKRKRGISSSGGRRRESSNEAVRIMFTGINPTRRHKQMITDIGANLVDSAEDALTATHVIASDGKTKLRRTPKLMICLCKTSHILNIDWLEQSAKEQRVLDCDDFLLLGDREAEKRYNFSMKETIENGRKARHDRGGVLGGWYVYICSGVAGNNAPSAKELNLVVEATGAEPIRSLSASAVSDPKKTIIITSDPITDKQRSEKGVERVTGLGAKLLTTSWLFHTIITQHFSTTDAESPAQHSGKRSSKRKASKTPPSHGNRRKSSRKR